MNSLCSTDVIMLSLKLYDYWDYKLFIAVVFYKNMPCFVGVLLSCHIVNLKLPNVEGRRQALHIFLPGAV